MSNLPTLTCANCQHEVAGNFCPNCGQKRVNGPYTWAEIKHDLSEKALGLERGLIRTLIDLSIRPGRMVSQYLKGVRKRYTTPIAYFALMITLFVAVTQLTELSNSLRQFMLEAQEQATGIPYNELSPQKQQETDLAIKTQVTIFNYYKLLTASLVPIYAFGWWLAARKKGFSWLETLILSLYINAQTTLFQALITLSAYSISVKAVFYASGVSTLLVLIYELTALKQFYQVGWIRALGITLAGLIAAITTMLTLGFIYGLYTGIQLLNQ